MASLQKIKTEIEHVIEQAEHKIEEILHHGKNDEPVEAAIEKKQEETVPTEEIPAIVPTSAKDEHGHLIRPEKAPEHF